MRSFWRFVFPGLFGLLIYTSIRLVTDAPGTVQFWHRPARQNMIEIMFTVGMGYLFEALMRYVLRQFKEKRRAFSLANVAREFAVMMLLCILFINPLLYAIHYLANDPLNRADVIIANIIVGLYVLLYYAIVRGNQMLALHVAQQTQVQRLKNEQLQTELKFLKAQYHPHFLFNALNTIYFQMDQDISAAKQTVEKFSELLRYQLYDQTQLVPVSQELAYLQSYIHLQKQRSSEKLKLKVHFDKALQQERIYPLLLQPLVENAFKYVGGEYVMLLEASKQEGKLYFRVVNSLPAYCRPNKEKGIGLANLQRRLELLYNGSYVLRLLPSQTSYTAELVLPL